MRPPRAAFRRRRRFRSWWGDVDKDPLEGGRDVTFPDRSEGGLWVESVGYKVTVHCPTRAAVAAVTAAVLDLQRGAYEAKAQGKARRAAKR